MRPSLESRIRKARQLQDIGRANDAFSLSNELIDEYPEELKTWALRAHLYVLSGDYDKANSDLTKAIEIDALEPYFLFRRGLNYMQLKRWSAAARDFTFGLAINDQAYEDAFRFARAESLISLGKKEDALEDLSHLPDGFQMWTCGMRSKAELISRCV